jgi:hypothetical protein
MKHSVFFYDPQLKRPTATWKLPSSITIIIIIKKKKPQQNRPKGTVMLQPFFNSTGIIHVKFIPEGVTVKKHH